MKNWVFPLAALLLLGGLFLWMRPTPVASPVPPAVPPPNTAAMPAVIAPPAPAAPVSSVFELVVKDQHLVSGPAVLSVVQGTPVTIAITVDRHDELHLHGYDLSLKLPAGQRTELHFVADRSGRFEYELHHSHLELGALEVQPQ